MAQTNRDLKLRNCSLHLSTSLASSISSGHTVGPRREIVMMYLCQIKEINGSSRVPLKLTRQLTNIGEPRSFLFTRYSLGSTKRSQ